MNHLASSIEPSAPASVCPNCDTPLAGPYCSACGQKQPDRSDLTMRAFVSHAADELLSADSKLLGSLRTLVLAPGQLTLDWWEGRRARWMAPLRLYLVLSAVFYLTVFDLTREQATAGFSDILAKSLALTGVITAEAATANMQAHYQEVTTILGFGSAVVMALIATACIRRPRRMYAEHFVAMLHYSAFTWLISIVVYAAWWWLGDRSSMAVPTVVLLFLGNGYLAAQLRTTLRASWGRAIGWTLVIFAGSYVAEVFLLTVSVAISAFVPA